MYCKSRIRTAVVVLSFASVVTISVQAQNTVTIAQPATSVQILDSTKQQDGLVGSVRRVKVEYAKLELKAGKYSEGPRRLLEITTYNLNGQRIENVSYPADDTPIGKEEYKYDDKGNIIQTTFRGADGSILSREAYEYEFDRFGNWKKMLTSLVLLEGADLKREPISVTYRTLTYYFDDAVANIVSNRSRATMPGVPMLTRREGLDIDIQKAPIRFAVSDAPVKLPNDPPPALVVAKKEQPQPSKPVEQEVRTKVVAESSKSLTVSSASSPVPVAAKVAGETSTTTPVASPPNKAAMDLYTTGRELMVAGDMKGAVRAFQQSLEIEPKSADVNLSLGYAYLKLEKTSEATKAFKQATALNPDMAEAYYGLGLNYFGLKKSRDAAEAFKRATKIRPDMAKAHYGLALAYQELGQENLLIEEYRILQSLNHEMARKLAATFPDSNLPCRSTSFCK